MRHSLVAVALTFLGCAGANQDPGSVVEDLSQDQIDGTVWLYNVQTRDLVASDALEGATDGFQRVDVRKVDGGGILACEPGHTGVMVDVLRDGGGLHPGDHDNVINPDDVGDRGVTAGDVTPGRTLQRGRLEPTIDTEANFGLDRFDSDILESMREDTGFYAFHPGCA